MTMCAKLYLLYLLTLRCNITYANRKKYLIDRMVYKRIFHTLYPSSRRAVVSTVSGLVDLSHQELSLWSQTEVPILINFNVSLEVINHFVGVKMDLFCFNVKHIKLQHDMDFTAFDNSICTIFMTLLRSVIITISKVLGRYYTSKHGASCTWQHRPNCVN